MLLRRAALAVAAVAVLLSCMPAPAASAVRPLVVGGSQEDPANVPWQVLFIAGDTKLCGGSLVSPSWVLTAGHCVWAVDPTTIRLWTGAANLYDVDETAAMTPIAAIVHPQYDPETYDNDLALLQLPSPVAPGAASTPVALPIGLEDGAWPAAGSDALVSGFGSTVEDGDASDVLRSAHVQVLASPSDPTCGEYGATYEPTMHLCAGQSGGGVDTCSGDSGGPLVVAVQGVPVLAGVTSVGLGCAEAGFPGLYTRTTSYLPWLTGYVTDASSVAAAPPAAPATPGGTTDSTEAGDVSVPAAPPGHQVHVGQVVRLKRLSSWAGLPRKASTLVVLGPACSPVHKRGAIIGAIMVAEGECRVRVRHHSSRAVVTITAVA